MATPAPPRVSRNVSLPAGRQPPTVAMLARRTLSESDLEPGAATAPSGSSSSSSLSSRSNESNTVAAEQQASQSDWSEEEEPLAAQWADSLPPHVLDSLELSATLRKRQEVIHELIVSEGSHVRWLRVLGGLFLRPLERHASLLPGDELRSLFPNLPAVRERHSRLYTELRSARNDAANHVVQIRPVADALLNALGDSGYASCVSKFCRGQRMALDALRERRRKSKELHQFLAAREQQPRCGRLQLKDMLACVWQRLTKYQLLLEGILKTVSEGDGEADEDLARLKRAHDVAKDVLHRVDTAIRTAENEHRLRSIQSKLEIRVPTSLSSEWDELRRLDLTQHALRTEGDLTLRNDSSKRINVLALMLEDSLVLLQREGDKFVLKPIPQPNNSQQQQLSPLIKWDKVLFRPNAAVRNTFFLMNINGVQMHELSANTASEYASWVKHIQEAPLAKLTELKSTITPSHSHSRSTDDSGINVSRNPSDASEKSSSTAAGDEQVEVEKERSSLERSSAEREDARREEDKRSGDKDERGSVDKDPELSEKEDKHKVRRPTVGRISTHGASPGALEPASAVSVAAPAAAGTATHAYTHQERLRRLDEVIARALRAKAGIVGAVLGVPPHSYAHLADLAVADSLGEVDVCGELQLPARGAELQQLLLAAHAQAARLTRELSRALSVTEAAAVAARARPGRCDSCARRSDAHDNMVGAVAADDAATAEALDREVSDAMLDFDVTQEDVAGCDDSFDDVLESPRSGAALASRLLGVSGGLQATLAQALTAAPAPGALRDLRAHLAALTDHNHALRARAYNDHQTTEEIAFSKGGLDPSIQDQPSNGG
ncbi:rho guanine nucleotide exchange factor 1-like isoform X2 [Trichoplusia ni]|uniref:Rho guanine nucleotide exchange factor 1-like isoform X2 n=1 Tax=Trichoplusia ni TaxID=7111 RepID=A0A7E5VWC2_TRINI|nr:rho guanine nucleotide exchange factor 1-like isoform X2 [Trichoplusia ni]